MSKIKFDKNKQILFTKQVSKIKFVKNKQILRQAQLREGLKKTYLEKVWSFAKPPWDPPGMVIFPEKKIDPHFFLEIRLLLGETNFTLGPISKSILFCF